MPTNGEEKAGAASPEKPRGSSGSGRRRRGRRGGRGRPRPSAAQIAPTTGENVQAAPETAPAEAAEAAPVQAERHPQRSAIGRAIDEVTQIIESLKGVLNQMEEVLELVELAERQQLADEREIESLRRALRQLQSPRGGLRVAPGRPPQE